MGSGQTAANLVGASGQNYANQAGQNYMNAGNARASGYVGSANAWSNAIGNAYNQYNQNQMMNQMFPQGGGGSASYDMLPDTSGEYYSAS
jgi:PPE-repeat protein